MKPLVSVIVPVYNAAEYLDDCISSIVAQTFIDWELLLINDGSIDDSESIIKKWEKRDGRIRHLYKTNGGVSSARNFGLDHACGEYVMFVDSDDICHPRILEILHLYANTGTDITLCGCIRFKTKPELPEIKEYTTKILGNIDELYRCMALTNTLHPPVAKIYRRDIIERNRLRFPIGLQLGEDVLFNLNYLGHASSGVYINLPLYYYRDTPSSLSKNIKKDYSVIQLRILSEKLEFISTNNISFDYTPYAPGIVRDIALTILRSGLFDSEKIDCLNNLRSHRIMDYCRSKVIPSKNELIAQAIKHLSPMLIVKLFK